MAFQNEKGSACCVGILIGLWCLFFERINEELIAWQTEGPLAVARRPKRRLHGLITDSIPLKEVFEAFRYIPCAIEAGLYLKTLEKCASSAHRNLGASDSTILKVSGVRVHSSSIEPAPPRKNGAPPFIIRNAIFRKYTWRKATIWFCRIRCLCLLNA